MSSTEVPQEDAQDPVGGRIQKLREGLKFTKTQAANRLGELLGMDISYKRFIEWENSGAQGYTLGALALLHSDPRACLVWLREGVEMAGIHVDSGDRHQAGESDAQYLRRKGGALVLQGKGYLKAAGTLEPLEYDAELPSAPAIPPGDASKGGDDNGES